MKNRIKKSVLKVVSKEEAIGLAHDVAVLMNCKRSLENQKDAKVLEVTERFGAKIAELDDDMKPKLTAVMNWALANPAEFAEAKSLDFGTARVGFRTGTPKLTLLNRSWNWDAVCETVQRLLPNFIRSKPELDKEAIIAQRDELAEYLPACGVKVVQGETFFLEPKLSEPEKRVVKEAA